MSEDTAAHRTPKTIFELSRPGRRSWSLPDTTSGDTKVPERFRRRTPPKLPEVSEPDLVRHFTQLSERNFAIDNAFYPLGSCTMKHNPKVQDEMAALPGFRDLHPDQPDSDVQGALALLWTFERDLCRITGMDAATFSPAAGAHGEITALLMWRRWFIDRGETHRDTVIIPDSAHGTNPASVRLAGFKVATVPSGPDGQVDVDALRGLVGPSTVGLMITNPNTLGVFESRISEITRIVHEAGGQAYCDGANMNAIVGRSRPGDMGFDVVHLNLHKTFSTPHGGGGPGAGPLCVKAHLAAHLPVPRVVRHDDGSFARVLDDAASIGAVHSFGGNFAVIVRAYAYLRRLGLEGLRRVSGMAVLNANYLKARVQDRYPVPYPAGTMHEFVASADSFRKHGVRTFDVAKALLDHGFHAPTIYFPLIVREALMVEPTETESKETLDAFADALLEIADKAEGGQGEHLRTAPHNLPVRRMDEAGAARRLRLRA
ncbi:MAG TPA: aminomethyl-transferring glycine dehydrogenase subunit GcvPB [Actinomycetota bacterium]|nr:aminomethyl-transferring glycine dehydrogenase subunit GcvPB [Actinomycetota bacterium]